VALRWCHVCQRDAGYATHKRTTRHHVGGTTNYDLPLNFLGYELAVRSVFVEYRANIGCCTTCWVLVQPTLSIELDNVRAYVPPRITGKPSRYRYCEHVQCAACAWDGHDGQTGEPQGGNRCPSCKTISLKRPNGIGFVVVDTLSIRYELYVLASQACDSIHGSSKAIRWDVAQRSRHELGYVPEVIAAVSGHYPNIETWDANVAALRAELELVRAMLATAPPTG
jgi:hypothetical protein